jgi:hypothetical protein
MIVTKRTKLSLCQFLGLFEEDFLHVLLEKHDIKIEACRLTEIKEVLTETDYGSIETLIDELVRTNRDLRNRVSPRYRFDERWSDFQKCLLLDGFKIQNKEIQTIEPVIDDAQPLEDDLTNELEVSGLSSIDEIIRLIRLSAESFRKSIPDYNACLIHARISLETMVKTIARENGLEIEQGNKAWGRSLSHIKSVGFISNKEEEAISSIYTLISDGAHIPVGFTEEDFARFGRNISIFICYFIIKKFNK